MGFGGAGPLHVNAVARLMGSWPAVSPVSPGVLCALGDATTPMRTEVARSLSRLRSDVTDAEVLAMLRDMEAQARAALAGDGVAAESMTTLFEIDVRYHGQAFEVPMAVDTAGFLPMAGWSGLRRHSTPSIGACSPSPWMPSRSS